MIQNEFNDQNVVEQFRIGPYALDFAWLDKKRCIEIDGKQHQTNPIQIASDLRKDEFLKKKGWIVLRVKWSQIFKETKETIQRMREFIEKS